MEPAGSAAADVPTVHETMTQSFTPQSNKLWELAGNLYDDDGELDASRLPDAQWQELAATATGMRTVAESLAGAGTLRVAAPGQKIQSEGSPGAPGVTEVQALIDADPRGFTQEAVKLAEVAADFITAAAARDAIRTDDASNRLNEVCTACHNRYWYPEQTPQ